MISSSRLGLSSLRNSKGNRLSRSASSDLGMSNTQLNFGSTCSNGPAQFNLQSYKGVGQTDLKISMKFSGRDPKRIDPLPSPQDYQDNTTSNNNQPSISFTERRGNFLDQAIKFANETAPGQYNANRSSLGQTGYRFKEPSGYKVPRHPLPGPADYHIKRSTSSDAPRLPDKETANRVPLKRHPGPSIEHNQQISSLKSSGAGGFSLDGLYPKRQRDSTPGPGSYDVTRSGSIGSRGKGITMGSRRAIGWTLSK